MKLYIRFKTERLANKYKGKDIPYPPPTGVFYSKGHPGMPGFCLSLSPQDWIYVKNTPVQVPLELGPLNSFTINLEV